MLELRFYFYLSQATILCAKKEFPFSLAVPVLNFLIRFVFSASKQKHITE